MTEEMVIKLFKCLADKSRLQIIKSLIRDEMYVERLSKRLDLAPSTVSFHLKKLEEVGVVESRKDQYYTVYSLKKGMLSNNILSLLEEKSEEASIQEKREEEYRQKVIKSFFQYGKLKTIPAQQKKQKIVFEEIVKSFEVGKEYTEREVNIIISDFHDDFCTIRRFMVGFGLLKRDNNVYRREL